MRFFETAERVLGSLVGFSQRRVVESLTKSGECSLAVLTEIHFSFSMDVERYRRPLNHVTFRSLEANQKFPRSKCDFALPVRICFCLSLKLDDSDKDVEEVVMEPVVEECEVAKKKICAAAARQEVFSERKNQ